MRTWVEDGAVRGLRKGVGVEGRVGVEVALGKVEENGAGLGACEVYGREEGEG